MSTISRLKSQEARLNPETQFENPAQLVSEIGLTRGQKLAALRRWEQKIAHELAAASEGMPSTDEDATKAALLSEIGRAILELEGRAEK